MNEKDVLNFMSLYAGKGLQEIYLNLNVVSDAIMSYLRINCPNVHTLGLGVSTPIVWHRLRGVNRTQIVTRKFHNCALCTMDQGYHNDYRTLQRLDLHHYSSYDLYEHDSEIIIPWLENCPRLQIITVTGCKLSLTWVKKLSELTNLCELNITCRYGDREFTIADNISATLGSLTSLTSFRLSCLNIYGHVVTYIPAYIRDDMNNDNLLRSIAHWTHLKVLALEGVQFTVEAFEIMILELLNLETLKLGGISVTSSGVNLIGIHLKKLKTLELFQIESYSFSYSNSLSTRYFDFCVSSLQSLSYHPMLENLVVRVRGRYENRILYEVLSTLPRIKNVKIILDDINHHFSGTAYSVIKSADIEVSESRKYKYPISASVIEEENRGNYSTVAPKPVPSPY
ncbi:uncharacterized protein [Amphiura filiformis]